MQSGQWSWGRIALCCSAEKNGRRGDYPPILFKMKEFPMSTLTYDTAPASVSAAPATVPAPKGKGFFARVLQAMVEARQRQALAEIRRCNLALGDNLDQTP
jgi:hypothetical protein